MRPPPQIHKLEDLVGTTTRFVKAGTVTADDDDYKVQQDLEKKALENLRQAVESIEILDADGSLQKARAAATTG